MNIKIVAQITCDQTGETTKLEQKDFGSLQLSQIIRSLLENGWKVSGYRDANGKNCSYNMSADGWHLIRTDSDGCRRSLRGGVSRENLWVTAPNVIPDPPFSKTALAVIEARERSRAVDTLPEPPKGDRVQTLEAQVAYLTAQIERLHAQEVAA